VGRRPLSEWIDATSRTKHDRRGSTASNAFTPRWKSGGWERDESQSRRLETQPRHTRNLTDLRGAREGPVNNGKPSAVEGSWNWLTLPDHARLIYTPALDNFGIETAAKGRDEAPYCQSMFSRTASHQTVSRLAAYGYACRGFF